MKGGNGTFDCFIFEQEHNFQKNAQINLGNTLFLCFWREYIYVMFSGWLCKT